MHMRTTLFLDDAILAEAIRQTGVKEKTAVVHLGLEALIQRESARRLAALGGSMPRLDVPTRPAQRKEKMRILADTSIWINHFRRSDSQLVQALSPYERCQANFGKIMWRIVCRLHEMASWVVAGFSDRTPLPHGKQSEGGAVGKVCRGRAVGVFGTFLLRRIWLTVRLQLPDSYPCIRIHERSDNVTYSSA